MVDAGRAVVIVGALFVLVGGRLILLGRFHLPGDLTFRTGGTTVYLPIATCIVISIVLTLILNLVFRQR